MLFFSEKVEGPNFRIYHLGFFVNFGMDSNFLQQQMTAPVLLPRTQNESISK